MSRYKVPTIAINCMGADKNDYKCRVLETDIGEMDYVTHVWSLKISGKNLSQIA